MAQDCFSLSGLTDCTVSTSQGVAWAGLFQPFGLKSRRCVASGRNVHVSGGGGV